MGVEWLCKKVCSLEIETTEAKVLIYACWGEGRGMCVVMIANNSKPRSQKWVPDR